LKPTICDADCASMKKPGAVGLVDLWGLGAAPLKVDRQAIPAVANLEPSPMDDTRDTKCNTCTCTCGCSATSISHQRSRQISNLPRFLHLIVFPARLISLIFILFVPSHPQPCSCLFSSFPLCYAYENPLRFRFLHSLGSQLRPLIIIWFAYQGQTN
jgi:hypothetical protein